MQVARRDEDDRIRLIQRRLSDLIVDFKVRSYYPA